MIRGFERELRIRELVDSGLIKGAEEVPAEALPAALDVNAVDHGGTTGPPEGLELLLCCGQARPGD